jgi:hypothetical protein
MLRRMSGSRELAGYIVLGVRASADDRPEELEQGAKDAERIHTDKSD